MEEVFPDLTVVQPEVNVFGGATLEITDTQLLIGGAVVASWSDKRTKQCKVGVTVNGKEVKSGDTVGEPGKLVLTVTNDQGKSTTAEITLKNDAFSGEVTLGDMHIDEEVNLLSGITLANDHRSVTGQLQAGQRIHSVRFGDFPDQPVLQNMAFRFAFGQIIAEIGKFLALQTFVGHKVNISGTDQELRHIIKHLDLFRSSSSFCSHLLLLCH